MATSERPIGAASATATVRREAVSIKTAAILLDVHPVTVRRLIAKGHLRAFRVGRVWRIHRAVLSAHASSR